MPQLPDARIALVTEFGAVNDAGFNQAVHAGVRTGARAIGAEEPKVLVPRAREDVPASITGLIEDGASVIVVAGDLGAEAAQAAVDHPRVRFIGVDQRPPCLTLEGLPDAFGVCAGDPAALLPNYTAISYREDQAGYLAGLVAASASPNGRVGMIGGISTCEPCIRYMQGFELGARAVNPDIEVSRAFVTDSDEVAAFDDAATGRAFAEAFIDVYQPDVLFGVAGRTGNGILDAACKAGILAVGVDVDQALAYPKARACLVTSATKSLARSVSESIIGVAAGTTTGGPDVWDASRDGVGHAPFYDLVSGLPADLPERLEVAYAAMQRGTLQTCPESCGTYR